MLLNRIILHIRATFFRLFECIKVSALYYRKWRFFVLDLMLFSLYFLQNPYKISRDFRKKRGEVNVHAYGETPLTTLDRICRQCQILSKDTVYELGCGRGKTSFWLKTFIGCKVIAIDHNSIFIRRANQVKKWQSWSQIEFLEENMMEVDMKKASVIYLYGTCMTDFEIKQFIENLMPTQAGTKIITVSFPLTEFAKSNQFFVEKQFNAHFPWGKADVYLNRRL